MSDLKILIKRAADGSAALTCVRADGTRTWQKQAKSLGALMPLHDLTHYAVETTLGYRDAFYGLIADGWDIADFAAPYKRGPVPPSAREAELIVSVFEMSQRAGFTADALREEGQRYAQSGRAARDGMALPELSNETIAQIRALRADVIAKWDRIAPGETLELIFRR